MNNISLNIKVDFLNYLITYNSISSIFLRSCSFWNHFCHHRHPKYRFRRCRHCRRTHRWNRYFDLPPKRKKDEIIIIIRIFIYFLFWKFDLFISYPTRSTFNFILFFMFSFNVRATNVDRWCLYHLTLE